MVNLKILVADTAEDVRKFVVYAISQNFNNIQTDTAADSREAKQKLDQTRYDLFICDWDMPNIKTVVLEWIKTHPTLSSTPFMMLTANAENLASLVITQAAAPGCQSSFSNVASF